MPREPRIPSGGKTNVRKKLADAREVRESAREVPFGERRSLAIFVNRISRDSRFAILECRIQYLLKSILCPKKSNVDSKLGIASLLELLSLHGFFNTFCG